MTTAPSAFSIVLPCYNEAENLPSILKAYRDAWTDLSAELILVNNGSTDATAAVLDRELAKPENQFARSVLVPVNQGYGFGVMAGVRAAKGRVIGISHADMQCAAADLFRAYDLWARSASPKTLIKGKRARRPLGAAFVTTVMATVASTVLLTTLTDINAQPKLFERSLLDHLTHPPNGFELDLYFLYTARKHGWTVRTIPVIFGKRLHGDSKWAFSLASRRKHIWATLKFILGLRFAALEDGN
jgi:glycosyltransferase involved in cell wall biosynthesis